MSRANKKTISHRETTNPMAKVINLIENHVGGMGNSLFTSYLVEFFIKYNLKYILVDLDIANPDVRVRYESLGNSNNTIQFKPKENRDKNSIDSLIDLVFESDTQAIVNVPARSLEYVEKFIDGYEFSDVTLRRWFISNMDRKSWQLFEMVADYDEEKYQMILVHNLINGLEMSSSQKNFCKDRDIDIIKMTWLQISSKDLALIEANPTIPLSSMLPKLSELGHKRLSTTMNRMFEWISPIIIGR